VEKRSSIHDPLVLQQQNLQYNQPTIMANDDSAKWILEPLVICPLDPTAFLRKELIEVCLKERFFCGELNLIYLAEKYISIWKNERNN
jgi:hypothetical protein